jgi:hypothetical protein
MEQILARRRVRCAGHETTFSVFMSSTLMLFAVFKIVLNSSGHAQSFLNFAVFAAIFFGWDTNCFPALVPSRFAAEVAAYSLVVKACLAFLGKYLSPVAFGPWVLGLPLLVPQSSLVHFDMLFWAEVFSPEYPPPASL